MKRLMPALVAFLVFFVLGSGAGAYAMKPAAADSTSTDSTHADSTHADSTPAETAHADSTSADSGHSTPPAGDTTPAVVSRTAHAFPAAAPRAGQRTIESLVRSQTGATVTMRPDGTIGPERPDTLPDYARMARLLSRMGPREAARTIEQLDATEAARAVAAMSDKQAALVLQQLEPEKAAALLRATLALLPKTATP